MMHFTQHASNDAVKDVRPSWQLAVLVIVPLCLMTCTDGIQESTAAVLAALVAGYKTKGKGGNGPSGFWFLCAAGMLLSLETLLTFVPVEQVLSILQAVAATLYLQAAALLTLQDVTTVVEDVSSEAGWRSYVRSAAKWVLPLVMIRLLALAKEGYLIFTGRLPAEVVPVEPIVSSFNRTPNSNITKSSRYGNLNVGVPKPSSPRSMSPRLPAISENHTTNVPW